MTNVNITNYKSEEKPTWCPGCGHFSALAALNKAFVQLQLPKENVAVISGIGCSSRLPFFLDVYGMHSAHGRALPLATGLKLARPDLEVVVVGGDGDALAIGSGHFMHAMRRNLNLTYILMDNQTYGMTKGQTAPTSMIGTRTKSTPYGSFENPIDPAWAALTMGASFVAQGSYTNLAQLSDLILAGIKHKGMSIVNMLSSCVTFNPHMGKNFIDANTMTIPDDYDRFDIQQALDLLSHAEKIPLGIIFENNKDKSLDEKYAELHSKLQKENTLSIHDLLHQLA